MELEVTKYAFNDYELQNINDDVSQILLKYLQNYWNALMSLSLSCKQWNTRINLFVTQRLAYHSPNTLVQSVAHRNKMYSELSSMMQHISDIRFFEVNVTELYDMVGLYSVPWDKDIAILLHDPLFLVLNIKDGSVIYREDGCTFFHLGLRLNRVVSFSTRLQMVAIESIRTDVNQILVRVFSIKDKKFTLLHTDIAEYKHPDRFQWIHLSDDGTVWKGYKPAYSITSPKVNYTMPESWQIVARTTNGADGLLIYYQREQVIEPYYIIDDEIWCYDTTTRQSWLYLRHSRLMADDASRPRITFHSDCQLIKTGDYDSALFQIVNGKLKFITTAEQLYDVELSPDRTVFFYAEYSRLTIYAIESGAEEYIQTLDWQEEQLIDYSWLRHDENICKVIKEYNIVTKELDKRYSTSSPFYDFHWMTNNSIFGVSHFPSANRIAVVDVNSPDSDVRELDLPLGLEFRRGMHSHEVVDERTVILHAAKEGSSVIIKVDL